MKTFSLTLSCVGLVLSLVGLPNVQAAGSTPDASVAADSMQESIASLAVRWEEELDRVAYALEGRALSEAGGDALVQSLLARADHLRVQREQLQKCAAKRPLELARSLLASVGGTPEASTRERDHVIVAIHAGEESAAP
ncbi:MAG: hypothetical protein ABI460_12505 [Caldimonas sp.]